MRPSFRRHGYKHCFPLLRKLTLPNRNMIKAELHSGVTEEVLKELVFIVQWKKDTSSKFKKKKIRNVLIIKKSLPTFIPC